MPDTAVQWTDTITVNTNTANTQRGPRIIQLDNGEIIVAWESNDQAGVGAPNGYDIIAQRYDQGGNAIGGEFLLNTVFNGPDQTQMSLAAFASGGYVTVFEDADGATDLRLEHYNTNGTLQNSETIIADVDVALVNYRNPEVFEFGDGSVFILYEEVNPAGSDLKGRAYFSGNDVMGPVKDVISGLSVTDASAARLANDGIVTVATVVDVNGDSAIYFRLLDDKATVGALFEVNGTATNGFEDSGARVEALTGGGFVVAWESVDNTDRDISFRLYNDDGTTSSTVKTFPAAGVSAADENYTELQIIALTDGGFAILAENATEGDLRLQRFNDNGSAVGTLIEIDDATESEIDITLLADGRMALVYNNGADIRMQIFDTRDAASTGIGNIGIGTSGADVLDEGTAGFNAGIFAGAGNDIVIVSNFASNAETFDGGTGIDTLQLEGAASASTIDLAAGTRFRNAAAATVDTVINFENAIGSDEGDTISGTDAINILYGLGGDDTLTGRGGADFLDGGIGEDTMVGGTGDDIYVVDNSDDIVTEAEGDGIDIVYTTVSYVLTDNVEIGVNLSTGAAGSQLLGNSRDNTIILTNAAATGNSTVQAGSGDDTIYVQNNTTIDGQTGNDTFVLNGNNNIARGSIGNDVYIVIGNDNTVTEIPGGGNDTIYSYAGSFVMSDHVETLVLITADANFAQNGTGNAAANTVIGSGSNNILAGLDGGDFLIGGGGDDILIGGAGLDVLQGNVGNDSFYYNNFGELGDVIQDWVSTDDSFYFFGLAFGFGAGTSLTDGVNFISSTGPFSVSAEATFLWDSDDYDLYYDGDGIGTGVNAVLVASLQDFTTVDVTDFIFF